MHRRRRRGVEGRTTGGAGRGVVRRDETENGGDEERHEGARGDAHVSTRALQSAAPRRARKSDVPFGIFTRPAATRSNSVVWRRRERRAGAFERYSDARGTPPSRDARRETERERAESHPAPRARPRRTPARVIFSSPARGELVGIVDERGQRPRARTRRGDARAVTRPPAPWVSSPSS